MSVARPNWSLFEKEDLVDLDDDLRAGRFQGLDRRPVRCVRRPQIRRIR